MSRQIRDFFRPLWQYGLPLLAGGLLTLAIAFLEGGFGPFSAFGYTVYAALCALFIVPLCRAMLGWFGVRLFCSLFVCALFFVGDSSLGCPTRPMVHTMYHVQIEMTQAQVRAMMHLYTEKRETVKGGKPGTENLFYWSGPQPLGSDCVCIGLVDGRVTDTQFFPD